MSRRHEFDHHIPGLTLMLGVVAVAGGAVLPWIQATTLKVGIDIKIFHTETRAQQTLGGFDKGVGGVLIALAVADVLALIVAVALMATRRRRGVILRFLALGCGLSIGALGAFFLAAPKQDLGDVFDALSTVGVVSIKPGPGAYLLALGGLLLLLGAVMPGRRKPGVEVA